MKNYIHFEHVNVYNFQNALRGMRNSFESWEESDSSLSDDGQFIIGDKDLKLALTLSKAGSSHGKFQRQIFICADIIAPEYLWKELDTYKIGTTANSTSIMHTAGKRPFKFEDFSFDQKDDEEIKILNLLNKLRVNWINSGKKKPSIEWIKMIQHIPNSFNYRRTWTANYQVLKSIYNDRKSHRLHEWDELCKWIESLPYNKLITLKYK